MAYKECFAAPMQPCVILFMAFEEILKYPNIERFRRIVIFSDSTYVVNNQNNAIYVWPKSKYRKAGGGLVENADIWKKWLKGRIKLSKLLRGVRVDLVRKDRRSNDHMKVVGIAGKKKFFKNTNIFVFLLEHTKRFVYALICG